MMIIDKKKPQLLTNRFFYRSRSEAPVSNRLFDHKFACQRNDGRQNKAKTSLKITSIVKNGPPEREKVEQSLREDMSSHLLGQVKNKFKQIFRSSPQSQNTRLGQPTMPSRNNLSHRHQLSVSLESGVITSLNKGKDKTAQRKVSKRRYVKLNGRAQNICPISNNSNQQTKLNVIDMVYFLKKVKQPQNGDKRQIYDDEETQDRYLISRHSKITQQKQQRIQTATNSSMQKNIDDAPINYQSSFLESPSKNEQIKPIKAFPIESLNLQLSKYGQFGNKLDCYEHPFLLKHKSSFKRSRNQNRQHLRSRTNKNFQIISIQ